MATIDYISIPHSATRLQPSSLASGSLNNDSGEISASTKSSTSNIRPTPKITTSLPHPAPDKTKANEASSSGSPSKVRNDNGGMSPTWSASAYATNLLPQILMSSGALSNTPTNPRDVGNKHAPLLSTRDPLSVPIMSVNFRRFVAIIGPVFWMQDRIEEILLWKRGWRVTTFWMMIYTFLCWYPRLLFIVPHAVLLAIICATSPSVKQTETVPPVVIAPSGTTNKPTNPASAEPVEGAVDWQGNIQGIQNLMGFVSDLNDQVVPWIPVITNKSPYTRTVLNVLVVTFLPLLCLVTSPIFPARLVCLIGGLSAWTVMHPVVWMILEKSGPTLLALTRDLCTDDPSRPWIFRKLTGPLRAASGGLNDPFRVFAVWSVKFTRWMDDDKLTDECWSSSMKEVDLYENERYDGPQHSSDAAKDKSGWSKANLKSSERGAWTRGRDGWSAVGGDGEGSVSSNLTFSLSPGWAFVETEDWRPDLAGEWINDVGADADGWVYTNEAWLNPHSVQIPGYVTRRRRWIRRVWYDSARADKDMP